jgi:hypothetical protein
MHDTMGALMSHRKIRILWKIATNMVERGNLRDAKKKN